MANKHKPEGANNTKAGCTSQREKEEHQGRQFFSVMTLNSRI